MQYSYLSTNIFNTFTNMKTPNIPSFFKSFKSKTFSFKPRYYDKNKERRKQFDKIKPVNIKFIKNQNKKSSKGKIIKVIFSIIILSLLVYIMIN